MRFLIVTISSLVCTLLFSCASKSTVKGKSEIVWVNSYKVSCKGLAPASCLQIRTDEGQPWQNFFGTIDGFNYELGYMYKLKIKKTRLASDSVPQDVSAYTYQLVTLLDKQFDRTLLLNDIWVLKDLMGAPLSRTGTDAVSQLYIEINLHRKQVLGNDGCGEISGKIVVLDNGVLRFGDFDVPNNSCEQAGEERLTTFLKKVNRYQIENGALILKENEKEWLTFKKVD